MFLHVSACVCMSVCLLAYPRNHLSCLCRSKLLIKLTAARSSANDNVLGYVGCSLSFGFVDDVDAHNHHCRRGRVAGKDRRVVAPSCLRPTARLQSSPVGRGSLDQWVMGSFRSWSSQLFRGRPGGRRHVRLNVQQRRESGGCSESE